MAINEANEVYRGGKQLNCEKYYCPQCHKRVILVISQQKNPFFKHVRLITGEGEKDEHLQSKQLLCAALVACGFSAQLEIPLAQGQLRADVWASEKLCFEIQCAPLSQGEFDHRHNLYKKIGIKDIWLVGKRHYLKGRLRQSQRMFIRYSQNWQWYYLEIDPRKMEIRLKYSICLQPISDNINYKLACFSLDEKGVNALLKFKAENDNKPIPDYHQQLNYLNKQIKEKTGLGMKVAELLYKQGLVLQDVPVEIFSKMRSPLEEATVVSYLKQKGC